MMSRIGMVAAGKELVALDWQKHHIALHPD
jgi:hypothetical protein